MVIRVDLRCSNHTEQLSEHQAAWAMAERLCSPCLEKASVQSGYARACYSTRTGILQPEAFSLSTMRLAWSCWAAGQHTQWLHGMQAVRLRVARPTLLEIF